MKQDTSHTKGYLQATTQTMFIGISVIMRDAYLHFANKSWDAVKHSFPWHLSLLDLLVFNIFSVYPPAVSVLPSGSRSPQQNLSEQETAVVNMRAV
jgi:hypothetical protein